MNEHTGHRKRLKDRCEREGLNSFEPHEVLELMLFFTIPQGDTNPLAHSLIREFGSVSGVLEASVDELMDIKGVGHHAASFFTLIPKLMRYYSIEQSRSNHQIKNIGDAGDFFQKLYMGEKNEKLYIACLDIRSRIINIALIAEGTVNEVPMYARKIVREVIRSNAVKVIIAHNHPGGTSVPSSADIELTNQCMRLLNAIDVRLLDHIVVGADGYASLDAGQTFYTNEKNPDTAYAAQYESDS